MNFAFSRQNMFITAFSILFLLAACLPLPGDNKFAPPASEAINGAKPPTLPEQTNPAGTTEAPSSPVRPEATQTMASTPSPEAVSTLAKLALPPPDEASARLTVPEGFAIRIFAGDLSGRPRFMAFGPDGALYLSLINAGQIMRLADKNQDGLADSSQVVADNLNYPHGLDWHDDWLYVAENNRVQRLRSSMGDGILDVKELVTDNIPPGPGHFTRTIHFGPDGKMYVSSGSSCNVCLENDPRRAAILRFNPDGSIPTDNPMATDSDLRKRPLWAWGLRNSVDFLWTPSGQMWANNNGRDNLLDANGQPDNLPPDVIIYPVTPGQFFGWPYCYDSVAGLNKTAVAQVLDNQSGLSLPSGLNCSQAVPALYTAPAHSAPLGMSLVRAGSFPNAYQEDLYVAYHGSWNVNNPANIRDCKVERIIIENGQPVSSEPFINGWRAPGQPCGSPSTYGRPAGITFGPDGAMYISDDTGGRVYRLIYNN